MIESVYQIYLKLLKLKNYNIKILFDYILKNQRWNATHVEKDSALLNL
jgi:hypothetical protein